MNNSTPRYIFKPELLGTVHMPEDEEIRYDIHCGELFIVVSLHTVYCYSIDKPELKWSYTWQYEIDRIIRGQDTIVIFGVNGDTNDNMICALLLDDGTSRWEIKESLDLDPGVITGERLICHWWEPSGFSIVCAYDLYTGEKLWVNNCFQDIRMVQAYKDRALCSGGRGVNNYLVVLDWITGDIITNEPIGSLVPDSYTSHLCGDTLLLKDSNHIIAYDLISRTALWTFNIDMTKSLNFVGTNEDSILVAYRYSTAYKKVLRISLADGSIVEKFEIENTYDYRDDFYIAYRGNRLYSGSEKQLLCYDLALHRTVCSHVDTQKTVDFFAPSYFHGNKLLTVNNFDNILNWYEIPELTINEQAEQEAQLRAQFNNEEWQYLRQTPMALMASLADLEWGSREEMLAVLRAHLQAVAAQSNLLVSCTLGDLNRELRLLLDHWAQFPPNRDHQLAWTCTLLAMHQDQALATGYKQALYQLAENFACSPRGEAPLALSEIPPLKP